MKLADRLEMLERQVERNREDLAAITNEPTKVGGATEIIKVRLLENIGDTTTDAANCSIRDFNQTAGNDVASGGEVEVYAWLDSALGFVDGDDAYAVYVYHRNRWEFLASGGGGGIRVAMALTRIPAGGTGDAVLLINPTSGECVGTPDETVTVCDPFNHPIEEGAIMAITMPEGGYDVYVALQVEQDVEQFVCDVICQDNTITVMYKDHRADYPIESCPSGGEGTSQSAVVGANNTAAIVSNSVGGVV